MTEYMSASEAKKQILEIGRRMYQKGFVAANDGNISCRISENTVVATPTGVSKGFMTEDMLVEMTLDGEILRGGEYAPSSEIKMHIRAYRENAEIMAVTHAHPQAATAFSIAGIALDKPILTEPIALLGSVPVAKYATPGTDEVPDSIAPFCTTHNAVLLANHGALTWGKDLTQAFYRLEAVENYAVITMYTENILGKTNYLSCAQIKPLLEIRKKSGNSCGGQPLCSAAETNAEDVLPQGGVLNGYMNAIDVLVERIAERVAEKLK
ncbi:MAG: class II aldolase/adducin family protein [Christensenella sp.]